MQMYEGPKKNIASMAFSQVISSTSTECGWTLDDFGLHSVIQMDAVNPNRARNFTSSKTGAHCTANSINQTYLERRWLHYNYPPTPKKKQDIWVIVVPNKLLPHCKVVPHTYLAKWVYN